jgi:hypothetical protein
MDGRPLKIISFTILVKIISQNRSPVFANERTIGTIRFIEIFIENLI